MTDIILIDLVNFQDYIIDNIKQLKHFNYNITVIASDNLIHHFNEIIDINIVKTSELDDCNYHNSSRIDGTFRNGFWKLCSQRLFYLYSYIKKYDIKNTLHIENDIMIYNNLPTQFDTSKLWITMDSHNRCIPGIIFIPNHNILHSLIQTFNFDKNDMENLAIFYHNNRDICKTFPIIQQNSLYDKADIYNENYSNFCEVFDAAAIGQYLGGVDARNIPGDSRGFINETCIVDYSKYSFIWKLDTNRKLYRPHILINNTYIPVFNLHIHSKTLHRFNSEYPLETKLIRFEDSYYDIKMTNYVSGEKLQSIADAYLGLDEDFKFNPHIPYISSRKVNMQDINNTYDNPYIVFCYAHRLNLLKTKLHFFKNQFILITHNSDENITDVYDILLYSNKIIHWYSQNLLIKHPKLHMLPIGIANSMWSHGNLTILNNCLQGLPIKKVNDVYFYFNLSTNKSERELCKTEIEKKGLVFGNSSDFNSYIHTLSTYKFAICPPGNGIDSHRIWECYYLGVIPILLRGTFTEVLENKLPCILLDTWGDFDKHKILPEYDTLVNKLKENIKYLDYNYYFNEIKSIKKKTVWFTERGRSGNNIFQYLAAEVIKHIYNFDCVAKYNNSSTGLTIDDTQYTSIVNTYIDNPSNIFVSDKDILLNGYFQKSSILLHLRPQLIKYFNTLNTTYINDKYTISDFSKDDTQHKIAFDNDALLVHFRLDDYIHNNSPPNIFDKEQYALFLNTIHFKKLYILCDDLRADWEREYIKYFVDKYQAIVLTGTLIDDFNLIKTAKRVVTSQSTFSWIAVYLGNAEEVYIPYSNFYGEHQELKDCHERCTVHYDIPFAKNLHP